MSQPIDTWILGPCAIEGPEYVDFAGKLVPLMEGRRWYYKASFDKANRSSFAGKRGVGLDQAKEFFAELKVRHPGIKLITDVHEAWQLAELEGFVDAIQIPAFLCRQTDLLFQAGKHFDVVNIKKGQWMSPSNACHLVDKVRAANPAAEVWICERGTFFGYGHLTVDFGGVQELQGAFDKVLLDCTHSAQRQKPDGFTGGDRILGSRYFMAAACFAYSGVFAEVHPNPSLAISDADTQLRWRDFPRLLKVQDEISEAIAKDRVS